MPILKKTKIVATMGPAIANEKMLKELFLAGVNVIRLNFSHGSHEEHAANVLLIRETAEKAGVTVALLQDLMGPKIRTGNFKGDYAILKKGSEFTFTARNVEGDSTQVSLQYKLLPQEVKKGDVILLDDGAKKLTVKEVKGDDIICRVDVGGGIRGRRGINVPGVAMKIAAFTEKDKKDFAFGLTQGIDYVALSFVRQAKDLAPLRAMLKKANIDIPVIAKIETAEAIENLDAIVAEADGIMVARGDLAVEVPHEDVPMIQKDLVRRCNVAGKPVIVATQMLESMIHSATPTRAEVSDVANSILDGADAVMLSAETAVGDHPEKAVGIMASIARKIESEFPHQRHMERNKHEGKGIVDAVGRAVVHAADDVDAVAIIALSENGFTPRMVSRYRPDQPIIVLSPNAHVANRAALLRGCVGYSVLERFTGIPEVVVAARALLLKHKYGKKGDKFVIAAGLPFGKQGGTNMLIVEEI